MSFTVNFTFETPSLKYTIFVTDNLNSRNTRHLYDEFKDQTMKGYETLIIDEVARGNFRDDISTGTLSYYLYSSTLSINKHFTSKYNIDFRLYAKMHKSVFDNHIEDFKIIVREHLMLLETAFRKI